MKTVFLETYGCQMNVADSEIMAGVIEHAGLTLVDRAEDADAVLLNTCAIREHAEQRVIGRLGEFAHLKLSRPNLVVGVAGCMAQHLRRRLLDSSRVLDLVVGPDGYRHLPELLRRAASEPVAHVRLDRDETYGDLEPRRGAGVRAWITVQRGCDKFCSYCVVPYTRGRERSLPLADLVRQVRDAVAQGFREVVFLGQTVNSYHDGAHDFADLLRETDQVEGLYRIRFTSPHPSDMSDRVIAAMAECERVCPQVHLPIQSGSDRVLDLMQRPYTLDQYRGLVARIRAAMPGVGLSTDVIVGFPGETEEDYQRTVDVMREMRYDARLKGLIELQQRVSAELNDLWIGRETEVLVESEARRSPEQLYGKNPQFKTVVFANDGSAPGTLRRVHIVGATPLTLLGRGVAAGEVRAIASEPLALSARAVGGPPPVA